MLPWFVDRVESARQVLEERSGRQYPSMNSLSMHDHAIRRNQPDLGLDHENGVSYKGRPRPRTHHYAVERPPEAEISRPRPRSFYENPAIGRDYRDQRNLADQRDVRIVGDSPWLFLSINTDGMKSSTRSACNEWLASPLDAGISRAHSTLAGAARQAAEQEHGLSGAVGARKIPWTRSWKCQTSVGDDPDTQQIPPQLRRATEIGSSCASSLLTR